MSGKLFQALKAIFLNQVRARTWFTEIIFQKLCVCMYVCMYVCMFDFLHPREQSFRSQKQPVYKR